MKKSERIALLIVGSFLALGLCVVAAVLLFAVFRAPQQAAPPAPVATATPVPDEDDEMQVEILSATGTLSESENCVTVEGEVENTSDDLIYPFLEVIVTYSDINHDFLSSDTTYIEYVSLGPGQVSPFKVLSCFDRAGDFEFYRLGLQTLMGAIPAD